MIEFTVFSSEIIKRCLILIDKFSLFSNNPLITPSQCSSQLFYRQMRFFVPYRYVFTITSYLIGVFIFATIVGQVGNVITNRNANRLEFERLLDGAKTYMRHHKVRWTI